MDTLHPESMRLLGCAGRYADYSFIRMRVFSRWSVVALFSTRKFLRLGMNTCGGHCVLNAVISGLSRLDCWHTYCMMPLYDNLPEPAPPERESQSCPLEWPGRVDTI